MSDYLLDKELKEAEERLTIKERLQNPVTIDYLIRIGIKPGWHCLEIGGGKGSITSWLCQKTGQSGKVTAVDQDTRFLEKLSFKNLEIIEGDILQYNPGTEKFDLVHSRDVLVHINKRLELIKMMTGALKCEGWILLEEPDVITDSADPLAPVEMKNLYNKTTQVIYGFLQKKGLIRFLRERFWHIKFTGI